MSTSTIENIAIGARPTTPTSRPGRRSKKTFRKFSFELSDLLSPAQARAWQASLKESFTNPQAFNIILQDMDKLDSELTEEIKNSPSSFMYPVHSLSSAAKYQEYVNSFISLFAQSKFCVGRIGSSDVEITESLFNHRCPKKQMFRRVAINPSYIADENPENPERLVTSENSNGVPINQLARMCDVAILKFLSTVNDKTDIRSIVWALDYLAEMTKKLEISLRTQSEVGWAGIGYRRRKDTIRRSVIDIPQLAVDGRPVVVGLGGLPQSSSSPTGPSSLINPETGQPTHMPLVPMIAISVPPTQQEEACQQKQVELEKNGGTFNESDTKIEMPSAAANNKPGLTFKLDKIKQDLTADKPKTTPPSRRQSTVDKPQILQQESSWGPQQRRNSTGSRPQGNWAPSTFVKRKTSINTALARPTVSSIVEEEDIKSDSESSDSDSDVPAKKEPIKVGPALRKPNLTSQESLNSSSLDFPRSRSSSPRSPAPSPLLSAVTSPTDESRPPHLPVTDSLSDTESDRSDTSDVPVKEKKTSEDSRVNSGSSSSLSDTKKLTKEDIERELRTLITYEGRISLLAILNAIIKLPSSPTLWTEDSWDACHKCFSLIQFCMDFGLDSSSKNATIEKPAKRLQQQLLSKSMLVHEKASLTYSRLVLQYAVKALIHCAVCTYAGCSSDGCLLGAFSLQRNSRNASQNLNKMIHQLERLYSNSPPQFRAAIIEFSYCSNLKQVFHFLHVILQYCPRGSSRDPLEPSSSRRDALIVLSGAVFRIVVDRMLLLDLSEQTVQHNLVKEMTSFIHYATTLFNQDFIRNKGFHNYYQYVQRVALSILLPPPPPQTPPTLIITPSPMDDVPEMGTFPRRKDKKKEVEEDIPGIRKRGRTINIGTPNEASNSPLLFKKSPRGQRKRSKQALLAAKDTEALTEEPVQKEHPVVSALKEEWRGLKIGALHQRIRRLTLLLQLSEPGTIPSPSLLSSLFTVGTPGTVVPKALILMECALFVQQLNTEQSSIWLSIQNSTSSWNIFYQLRSWGEAIGEGLKHCVMRENELSKHKDIELTEEPIFPAEQTHGEITKFLREPPQNFLPLEVSTGHYLHSSHHLATPFERKHSNISNISTDSELGPIPTVAITPIDNPRSSFRRISSEQLRLNPAMPPPDDGIQKSLSVQEQPASESTPFGRKVSIYLRVNSRHGLQTSHSVNRKHPPPGGHGVEVPPDTYKVLNQSPLKQSRRKSMSALLHRQTSTESHHGVAISSSRNTSSQDHSNTRRMSFSGANSRETTHPTTQRQNSSSSNLRINVTNVQRRRPSVISKVNGFFRGRQIAFRRRNELNKKQRTSTTTQTSSAGSSPSVHRKLNQASHDSASYSHKVEEIRSNFPWLDIVKHIVASSHKVSQETKFKRKRSCNDMMSALKHIYSVQFNAPSVDTQETVNTQNGNTSPSKSSMNRRISISTVFSDSINTDIPAVDKTVDKTPSKQTPECHSSSSLIQKLAKLDFSGLRLRMLLEYGSTWGNFESNLYENDEITLDQLIETDSATNLEKLMSNYNIYRLKYCDTVVSGLLHAPFSLLTYAGPVLSVEQFKDIQIVTWDSLLDHDPKCVDSAASFFLLSCLKLDKQHMNSFVENNIKTFDLDSVKDAVKRFKILWRCRDSVWSMMEESAPKLFKIDEVNQTKDSQSIGYCLPSHLMGSSGDPLPHPPWNPQSVCNCTCDSQSTTECYQSTHHAPLTHLSDISKDVLCYNARMTNLTYLGEESASTILEVDKEAFEHGILNVKEYINITLFPNTLLPLIAVIIRALSLRPVSTDLETTTTTAVQVAEYTEEVLWQCMIEQPHSLFYPLLNEFNTLYQIVRDKKRINNLTVEETAEEFLGDILKPFHILLSHYSVLPPETSRYLFNNFIGILMRHTEQPLEVSDMVIHSLLCLLRIVVPSVNDLSLKELKNQLKRASCYTTLLTTARIRGVERVRVNCSSITDSSSNNKTKEFIVDSEDMSFLLLIAKVCNIDPSSNEFVSTLQNYYFIDEKTHLPVLSSLIIQDHYSDSTSPIFSLHESESYSHGTGILSQQQMQLLLTHKLCEVARVMFACQMLINDSHNEETANKFTEPNSQFIFEELLQLSSFPRKALDSVFYEVGPAALQKWRQLKAPDTMLRGAWSKFMLTLFSQLKDDSQSDDSVILFLTVLNGSLLLQSEDHIVLRNTLAALLTAAAKFESVFRTNGYQMIVPSLVQAYAIHIRNKMVTDAIKLVWIKFYWQNKNIFLLQAISSIANLFESDVSSLAASIGLNFSPLKFENTGLMEEQKLLERATISLISSLNCREDSLPADAMDILGACPKFVKDIYNERQWSSCNLDQLLTLCVTVASYNPEVLRGMQILVFLDHLMPLLVKEKDIGLCNFVRSLIKGCQVIKRSQAHKGDILSRKGTISNEHEQSAISNPLYKRIMFRNRSGTSQELGFLHERTVSELPPSEQRAKIIDGFKSRRINDVSQDITHISRNCLLSIASQYISNAHSIQTDGISTYAPSNNRRYPLDVSCLTNVATIIDKVIKNSHKLSSDYLLRSNGLRSALLELFPQIEWSPDNKSAFTIILDRAVKFFKKLQIDNVTKRIHHGYIWELAETILESIYRCIEKHPFLIRDNESILNKLKMIIDMCLIVKPSSQGLSSSSRSFICDVPDDSTFTNTVVNLMAEIIAICQTCGRRQNGVLLRSFFSGKLHFKDAESSFVWKKLFLPLAINLGLRENMLETQDDDDALFLTETISQLREQIHVIIKYRSSQNQLQIKRFFTDLKVILAAFDKKFSLESWMKIGFEIISLATKYDYTSKQRSAFGDDTNEMYIIFCSMFLDFMESFLLTVREPIFSVIWPSVSAIERQLKSIDPTDQSIKSTLLFCLQKCTLIRQIKSVNPVTTSRQEILLNLTSEFLPEPLPTGLGGQPSLINLSKNKSGCSSDMSLEEGIFTVKGPPKRRNSKAPNVPVIMELQEAETPTNEIDFDGDEISSTGSMRHHKRPTTLSFDKAAKTIPEKKGKKSVNFKHTSIPKQTALKQRITEDDEDDEKENVTREKKPSPNRRRIPRNLPRAKTVQYSEDADEESGVDSPRSSFSYARPPATNTLLSTLQVTAEVHPYPSTTVHAVSPLTTNSIRSPPTSLDETRTPLQRNNNLQVQSRPQLTRDVSIHSGPPDEQTGQPRKESLVDSHEERLHESSLVSDDNNVRPSELFGNVNRVTKRHFNEALNESLNLMAPLQTSTFTEQRSETLL